MFAHAGHQPAEVLLPGAASKPEVGQTPWSLPRPFVVDMRRAADELGYRAVTTYGDALPKTLDWLAGTTSGRDWRPLMAGLAAYPWDLFDYDAEDRFLGGPAARCAGS